MAGTRNESKQAVDRLEQLAVPQSSIISEKPLNVRRADQMSALPWLDGVLRKIQLSDKLRLLLRQADLPWTGDACFLYRRCLAVLRLRSSISERAQLCCHSWSAWAQPQRRFFMCSKGEPSGLTV